MKKITYSAFILAMALVFVLSLASCEKEAGGLWDSATYQDDAELGEGGKTLIVEVLAEDKKITFTIHTDEDTVGEALLEHGLLEGEEGPYGLYVKKVNGILADFDKNQSYWAFYINGEYAMTGVDGTEIEEGAIYKLAYTK